MSVSFGRFWMAFPTILLWLPSLLMAQAHYKSLVYTTKDGLSSDLCRQIYQDRTGFLWISSDRGLNRYDGNSFYTFTHRHDDQNSLANNSCNGILEDSKGRLWINTDDGLSSLDRKKQTFRNFYPDTTVMPVLGISYTEMAEDHSGKIWLGGYYDVLIFDPEKEKFYKSGWYDFALASGLIKTEKRNSIAQSVVRKSDAELWLMTVYGLFSVNTVTNKFTYYPNPDIDEYFAFVIRYIDHDGVLWIGTYDQCFYTFDVRKNQWTHHRCPERLKGIPDQILSINAWDKETMLMARTDQVFKYHIKSGEFSLFDWEQKTDKYKEGGFTHTLVADDQVFIMRTGNQPFIHLLKQEKIIKKTKIPLPENYVNNHSYYTKSGKILTGDWDRNMVMVCDSIRCTELSKPDGSHKIGNLQLYFASNNGNQYFSTSKHVYIWQEKENKAILCNESMDSIAEAEMEFRNFVEDKRGNIYIRERHQGIYILQKGEKQIKLFRCEIDGQNYSALYYDNLTDKLWLAAEKGGLYIIDPANGRSKNYKLTDLMDARKGFIYDISGDVRGHVFLLLSARGLMYIQSKDMVPRIYTSSNGLLSDAVKYGITDHEGIYWFTTESGLMAFDYRNERFYTFADETDAHLFTYRIFKDINGNIAQNLYPEEILTFDRRALEMQQVRNHIYLKEVKLFGKIVPSDTAFIFDYNQNSLVFVFGNLGKKGIQPADFQYRINQQSWQPMENHAISMYDLLPAKYTIQVRNKYAPGEIFTVYAEIVPPWWRTTWFFVFLVMLISGLTYFLYKKRISDILKEESEKNLLKQRIAEIEMTALRAQMNPHFIFNCLNAINRFILINNTEAASEYLTQFSRLIRMILDATREDVISLDKELDALKLYIAMESMRFQDQFDWHIEVDKGIALEEVMIPPLILQPFVENAIWHGLLQAPADWGVKILNIHIYKGINVITIEISDNGIGREKALLLKSKTGVEHKSYGIQLTEERLRLLQKTHGTQADVVIEDLYHNSGHARGTSIKIILKNTMI